MVQVYIWVTLYQRNQISIITDAVFLGRFLQFSPVQETSGVKVKQPGLCHPWENQENLQAAMASTGRELWEADVGQRFPTLQEHWEQNTQVAVKSSDASGRGAAEIPREYGSVLSQISQHLNIVAQPLLNDM